MVEVPFLWIIIISLISVVIWYFINRASVRANRQVELLESIDRQLTLITGQDSIDTIRAKNKGSKSAQSILDESRKKADL